MSQKQDTLVLPITSRNVERLSKYFHSRTQQTYNERAFKLKIPPHPKCIATLPCESKYRETIDIGKRLSRLTGILNLLQLVMFRLTYVAVNIQNVLLWLECKHPALLLPT